MTMTRQEYLDQVYGEEIDGAEVRCFEVTSRQPGAFYITEHKIVYHSHTPWRDHDWGRTRSGADFVNTWTHERWLHDSPYEESNNRWLIEGRWDSWQGPADALQRSGYYGTMEEAEAELTHRITQALIANAQEFKALNDQLTKREAN